MIRRTLVAVAILGVATLGASCAPASPAPTGSGCPTAVHDPAGPAYKGVPYGDGLFRTANIYPACTASAVGTIMYMHGGGYTSGDRFEGDWPWIRRLRSEGWVVVSIDYRLAPLDVWPAQPNDVRTAINWWRNTGAAQYEAPAYPLVGMGWSAGAQMAEWVTLDDSGAKFDAAVSVSGSTYWPDRPDATATKVLFGLPGYQDMAAMIAASSVTKIDPSDPPLLHIHGANDPLVPVSQANLLADAIATDGNPAIHQVVIVPDCGHSLACMEPDTIDPFLASIASP